MQPPLRPSAAATRQPAPSTTVAHQLAVTFPAPVAYAPQSGVYSVRGGGASSTSASSRSPPSTSPPPQPPPSIPSVVAAGLNGGAGSLDVSALSGLASLHLTDTQLSALSASLKLNPYQQLALQQLTQQQRAAAAASAQSTSAGSGSSASSASNGLAGLSSARSSAPPASSGSGSGGTVGEVAAAAVSVLASAGTRPAVSSSISASSPSSSSPPAASSFRSSAPRGHPLASVAATSSDNLSFPSSSGGSSSAVPPPGSEAARTQAKTLLKETRELERQLRVLQRSSGGSEKAIFALRKTIRHHYRQVIYLDLAFAAENEVEQALWKYVFYKQIEELRKMLRQYAPTQPAASNLAAGGGASGGSAGGVGQSALLGPGGASLVPSSAGSSAVSSFSRLLPSGVKESSERYARLSTFFRQFLRDSKKFYRSLLNYHLKVAKVQRVGGRFRDMLLSRGRRRVADDVELDLFDDSGDDDEEDGDADESSVSNLSDHEGGDEQQHSHSSNDDKDGGGNNNSSSFSAHPSSSSSFNYPSGAATPGLSLAKLYSASELATMQLALQTCHRSLIFLGDLERYSQLILGPAPDAASSSDKDWRKSERYYRWALALMSLNGNPHNQLAVVATYKQNNLLAVHRYFRSIAVKQPFATAMQNLKLLFDKANAACFDTQTEVLMRVGATRQSQWLGASALMRLWAQPTLRPLLQVASLQTADSSSSSSSSSSDVGDDRLVYAPLIDIVPPFHYAERYAAHEHPVRVRSSESEAEALSPSRVDLLLTGDHKVWASSVQQPHHFQLLPAAQLVSAHSDSTNHAEKQPWAIQTSAAIESHAAFLFTLPSLSDLLLALSAAGVDIAQWRTLPGSHSQCERPIQFSGAAMDAWLAFVGVTLATAPAADAASPTTKDPPAATRLQTNASHMRAVLSCIAAVVDTGLADLSALVSTSEHANNNGAAFGVLLSEPRLLLYSLLCSNACLPLPSWLWHLSAPQLRVLLTSACHSSVDPTAPTSKCGISSVVSLWCATQLRADQLHSLAVHAGVPCHLRAEADRFVLRLSLEPSSAQSIEASATLDLQPETRTRQFWCVTTAAPSRVVMVRRRSELDEPSPSTAVYSSALSGNCSTPVLHQQHRQHHPAHKLSCAWYEPGMATVKLLDSGVVNLLDVLYTGRSVDSGVCLSHAVVTRLEQLLLVPAAVAPVGPAAVSLTGQRSVVQASGGVSVNLYCLQLLLDAIFCVHQHVPATNIITSDDKRDGITVAANPPSSDPPASPQLPASFFAEPSAGSLSFLFLFDLLRSLMSCMSIHHPASLQWLGIVGVWCDWLQLHASFIDPLPASVAAHSPRSQPADEPPPPLPSSASATAPVPSSPYLEHQRVVHSRCWHAFAHACNVLAVAVNSTATEVVEAVQLPDQPPLREELEVYGFSYLAAAYPALTHDFYWRRSDPQSIAELTGATPRDKETHSPPSVFASTVVSGSSAGSGSGSGSGISGVSSSSGSLIAAGRASASMNSASSSSLPPSHKSRAAVSSAGLDRKQYRRAVKVLRFADYLLGHSSLLKQDAHTGHFFVESELAAGEASLPLALQRQQQHHSAALGKPATSATAALLPHAQPSLALFNNQQHRSQGPGLSSNAAAAAAATGAVVRSGHMSVPAASLARPSNSQSIPSVTNQPPSRSPTGALGSAAPTFPNAFHQQPAMQSQAQSHSQQQAAAMAAINAHIQRQQQQQPGTMAGQRLSTDRGASALQQQPFKPSSASSGIDASAAWRDAGPVDRTLGRPSRPQSAQVNNPYSGSAAQSLHRAAAQQAMEEESADMDAMLERRMAEQRQRQWKEAEHDNGSNQHAFEHSAARAYASHGQPHHSSMRGLISAPQSHMSGSIGGRSGHGHSHASRQSSGGSSLSPRLTGHAASSADRYRSAADSVHPRSSGGSPPLFGLPTSARSSDGWENYRGGDSVAVPSPTTAAAVAGQSHSPQPPADDDSRGDSVLSRGWSPFDSQSSHPLSFLHQSLFSASGPSLDAFPESEPSSSASRSRAELLNHSSLHELNRSSSNQPGAAMDTDRLTHSSPSSRTPSPLPGLYTSHLATSQQQQHAAQPGALQDSSPPPPGFRAGLLAQQPTHHAWPGRLDEARTSSSASGSDRGSGLLSGRSSGSGFMYSDASASRVSGGGSGGGGGSAWSTSIGQQLTSAYSRSLHSFGDAELSVDGRQQQQQRERYLLEQQQYDAVSAADEEWAMRDGGERLEQQDIPSGLEELLDGDDDGGGQQQAHYLPHSAAHQPSSGTRSYLRYDAPAAPAALNTAQSSSSPSSAQPYRPPHMQAHRQPPLPRSQPPPHSAYQQQQSQHGGRAYR